MTKTEGEDNASKKSKPDSQQSKQSTPRQLKYPNQTGKIRNNPTQSDTIRYCLRSAAKNMSPKSVYVKSFKIADMPGFDQTIAPSTGGIPNVMYVTSFDRELQSRCDSENRSEDLKNHLSRLGIEHGAAGNVDGGEEPLHTILTVADSAETVHQHVWPTSSAKKPYKIGSKLGSGSEGTVYAGEYPGEICEEQQECLSYLTLTLQMHKFEHS